MTSRIRALFLDIGGVLLTNGWDHDARRRASARFGLNHDDVEERHHMTFTTYEEGKLSLEQYLDRVVFNISRPFSREEFRAFMFAQSAPLPECLDFFRTLKARHHLKAVAVSNEGRELTEHRIHSFSLDLLIDFFISSCFVHFRKPDHDIYRIALATAQVSPAEVAYVDDRLLFVEVARTEGIRGVHHTALASTKAALREMGLGLEGDES